MPRRLVISMPAATAAMSGRAARAGGLRGGERGGHDRGRRVQHRRQVRVVEVERVRERAVDQRGRGRGAASPPTPMTPDSGSPPQRSDRRAARPGRARTPTGSRHGRRGSCRARRGCGSRRRRVTCAGSPSSRHATAKSASCWTCVRSSVMALITPCPGTSASGRTGAPGGTDDVAAARARAGTRRRRGRAARARFIVSTMLMPWSTRNMRCTGQQRVPGAGLDLLEGDRLAAGDAHAAVDAATARRVGSMPGTPSSAPTKTCALVPASRPAGADEHRVALGARDTPARSAAACEVVGGDAVPGGKDVDALGARHVEDAPRGRRTAGTCRCRARGSPRATARTPASTPP